MSCSTYLPFLTVPRSSFLFRLRGEPPPTTIAAMMMNTAAAVLYSFCASAFYEASDILWLIISLKPVVHGLFLSSGLFLFMGVGALGSLMAHGPELGFAMAMI